MSNRNIIIVVVIILLIGVGIWGGIKIMNNSADSSDKTTNQVSDSNAAVTPQNDAAASQTPASATAKSEELNGCTRTFDSAKLASAKVDIANKFVILNVKNFGDIKLEIYDKDAPKTAENFLRLVNAGYYDCLTFHRVAKGFVIQSGDPTGKGSGGDSAFGGKFADELNPATPSYKTGYVKGVLAMANAGPNTNTSQFFILIGDATQMLPHSYTIFGKVVSGIDVADKIGLVDITPAMGPTDGAPKTPVVIEKATISNK